MSVRQSFAAKVSAATVVVLVLVVGSSSALAGAASPRGGDLVVAKECSGFVPANNPPYCQITASSLRQIEVGSKIFYLDPDGLGTIAGGAVVLDLPGPGNNKAFGTCFLAGIQTPCTASSRAGQGSSPGSTPASWLPSTPMGCGTGLGRTTSAPIDLVRPGLRPSSQANQPGRPAPAGLPTSRPRPPTTSTPGRATALRSPTSRRTPRPAPPSPAPNAAPGQTTRRTRPM